MWYDIQTTASQWMHFYATTASKFFRNMTPNQYMVTIVVTFLLCLAMMRVKFAR